MLRNVSVGIDIGSHSVKVVVTETISQRERVLPRILGIGESQSTGVRHGYVSETAETVRAIKLAIRQAEKTSGIKIKKAFVGISGTALGGIVREATTMITRADSEITNLDLEKIMEVAENEIPRALIINRKILHSIPIQYKIDGTPTLGFPEGMRGIKLDVKVLFVTCLEHHMEEIAASIERAGIEIEDMIAAPMAASLVTLSKIDKIAGCVLANIGSQTVSIAVYENSSPISLDVFKIGSNDITNDIALGLKIPLEEAETVKVGNFNNTPYSRKKLEEIVGARLADVFELIDSHLKKIGKNGLLPAGIILVGGGSAMTDIVDFAKITLRIPARVAEITDASQKNCDPAFAVAYGLAVVGHGASTEENIGLKVQVSVKDKIIRWLKQFLP